MDFTKLLTGGWLKGYKTYLVAVAGLFALLIQYLAGDATLQVVITEAAPLLGFLFLRKGSKADAAKIEAAVAPVPDAKQEKPT